MNELEKKIYDNISNYLKFDLKEIFSCGDPIIFGGAVRDSIANQEIHDVDIICINDTSLEMNKLFKAKSFEFDHNIKNELDYFGQNYTPFKLIFKIITFIKDKVKIQCISPEYHIKLYPNMYKDDFLINLNKNDHYNAQINLAKEVDLSCCGVIFDHNCNLIETVPGAIRHCIHKKFKVLKDNIMHQKNRINERINKMILRGWERIDDLSK